MKLFLKQCLLVTIFLALLAGAIFWSLNSYLNTEELNAELIVAARKGDIESMRELIENGADINGRALDGWTPLTRAASIGEINSVKYLLGAGADINYYDASYNTPLFFSCFHGHIKMAKLIRNRGGKFDKRIISDSYLNGWREFHSSSEFMKEVEVWLTEDRNSL